MKKFYKKADFVINENPAHPRHLYKITLDGKTIKTPSMNLLAVPTKQLAFLISNEFNMQVNFLKPNTMPLLSLSRAAVDMDLNHTIREHLEQSLLDFLGNDTICFRDELEDLAKLQSKSYDPLIEFTNKEMGVSLKKRYGLEASSFDIS
jgi:ATP synthase F1 complex assembly factor 2